MGPIETLKTIREKRIDRQLEEIAFPISIELIDNIGVQEGGPHYSYDIGKKPRGMSGAEYTGKIAQKVALYLARVGLEDQVVYDPAATKEASTENLPTSEFDWRCELRDEMRIVFTKNEVAIQGASEAWSEVSTC